MPQLDAAAVAKLLREFAARSAFRAGNPYRAKAYARAADSLSALAAPLGLLIAEGRTTEIPGVGKAIADIITKLHRTGTHPSLEAMREEVPAGVVEMLSVPGLKPDRVLKLHKLLGALKQIRIPPRPADMRVVYHLYIVFAERRDERHRHPGELFTLGLGHRSAPGTPPGGTVWTSFLQRT